MKKSRAGDAVNAYKNLIHAVQALFKISTNSKVVNPMKLSKPQTDIIFVASLTLLFGMAASRWELSEHITEYSYVYEHIQLDEWPFSFLVLSMGLAWYSW